MCQNQKKSRIKENILLLLEGIFNNSFVAALCYITKKQTVCIMKMLQYFEFIKKTHKEKYLASHATRTFNI